MFDFITNIFNGIKNVIVDTVINPVKQLFKDIKDGYWFSGFIDFCIDSPIGTVVAGLLCVGTLLVFTAVLTAELTGFVALAGFIVGYIVTYCTMFLFFLSCIHQVCKALCLVGPMQLTARKRARKLHAQLVA